MDKAAAKGQRLSVYFFNGKAGHGKISSWEACRDDAIKRDYFYAKKARVLNELPKSEKARLDELSSVVRDDSQGEEPGSARTDEEELVFVNSLSDNDRAYWLGHRGLGNSQKAEVAWLEKQGYSYVEREVSSFAVDSGMSTKRRTKRMTVLQALAGGIWGGKGGAGAGDGTEQAGPSSSVMVEGSGGAGEFVMQSNPMAAALAEAESDGAVL